MIALFIRPPFLFPFLAQDSADDEPSSGSIDNEIEPIHSELLKNKPLEVETSHHSSSVTVSIFGALSEILSHTTESLSFLTSSTTESAPLAHTHHAIITANEPKRTASLASTTAKPILSDPFDDLTLSSETSDETGFASPTTVNRNDKRKSSDEQVLNNSTDTMMTLTLNETKLSDSSANDPNIGMSTIETVDENALSRDGFARSIGLTTGTNAELVISESPTPDARATEAPTTAAATTEVVTTTAREEPPETRRPDGFELETTTNNALDANTHPTRINETQLTRATANVIIITAQTTPSIAIGTSAEPLTTTTVRNDVAESSTINDTDDDRDFRPTTIEPSDAETTPLTVSITSPISSHPLPPINDTTPAKPQDPPVTNIDLMTRLISKSRSIEDATDATDATDAPRPVYVHETPATTTAAAVAYEPRFAERIPILPIGFYANSQRSASGRATATNPPAHTSTTPTSSTPSSTTPAPMTVPEVHTEVGQSTTTPKSRRFDFVIYGILPNKTVIRKYPDDVYDDAADDSNFIYGMLGNGSLIKKYANGSTVIDARRSNRKFEVTNIDVNKLLNPNSDIYKQIQRSGHRNAASASPINVTDSGSIAADRYSRPALNKTNSNCTNLTDTNCIKNTTNSLPFTHNTVNSTSDFTMVFNLPIKLSFFSLYLFSLLSIVSISIAFSIEMNLFGLSKILVNSISIVVDETKNSERTTEQNRVRSTIIDICHNFFGICILCALLMCNSP